MRVCVSLLTQDFLTPAERNMTFAWFFRDCCVTFPPKLSQKLSQGVPWGRSRRDVCQVENQYFQTVCFTGLITQAHRSSCLHPTGPSWCEVGMRRIASYQSNSCWKSSTISLGKCSQSADEADEDESHNMHERIQPGPSLVTKSADFGTHFRSKQVSHLEHKILSKNQQISGHILGQNRCYFSTWNCSIISRLAMSQLPILGCTVWLSWRLKLIQNTHYFPVRISQGAIVTPDWLKKQIRTTLKK